MTRDQSTIKGEDEVETPTGTEGATEWGSTQVLETTEEMTTRVEIVIREVISGKRTW